MQIDALVTDGGREEIIRCIVDQTPLILSTVQLGDGGGVIPTISPTQTALVNPIYSKLISEVTQLGAGSDTLIVKCVFPSDSNIGGIIREVGFITSTGVLFAVSTFPNFDKDDNGMNIDFRINFVLKVTNADEVTIIVDPSAIELTVTTLEEHKHNGVSPNPSKVDINTETSGTLSHTRVEDYYISNQGDTINGDLSFNGLHKIKDLPNASANGEAINYQQYLGLVSGSNPAGTIIFMSSPNSVPNGYLRANGQAVSRTTYASLFSVISTIYGAGDGITTFNVPTLSINFGGVFLYPLIKY